MGHLSVNPVWRIIVVRTVQVSLVAMLLHWVACWPLTGPHALGLWLTLLLCLYFVFVFVGPWSWGLPIRTRLPISERSVALTFDDGPSRECTPRILDALAAQGAHATFFVLGACVRQHPELVRRIASEGHTLGIHGDQHEPFVLLSWSRVRQEIAGTRQAIREACPAAAPPVWLRPPHGFKTLTLAWVAQRMGCRLVAWSVNTRDYQTYDPAVIAGSALAHLRPGTILLLHDGAANGATVEALPAILRGLSEKGYTCVAL